MEDRNMISTEVLSQLVINGDADSVVESVKAALEDGLEAKTILQALVNGMDRVGEEWHVGNMFIPEVLLSAKAMQSGMTLLRPHLTSKEVSLRGKVVIGTVQGDLHDIGKSLVGMMIEGAGFEVIDLGVDIPAAKFVEAVKTHQPDLIGLSTLLTTTMPYMRDVINSLTEAGLRSEVKVIIGGAPATQEFADSIGADGYAPDGASAVHKVRELIG
jgi:5-methyltetrahydrofolate--homocysteine methyltransferase